MKGVFKPIIDVPTFQPTLACCRSAGLAVAGVVGAQDGALLALHISNYCHVLNMRYVFLCLPSPSCCVVFVVFLCCVLCFLGVQAALAWSVDRDNDEKMGQQAPLLACSVAVTSRG